MPWSALSSTLLVGVISFPMDHPKILGFLRPENRRRLSHAHPTATVLVVLTFCLLCEHRRLPALGRSHQPPCGFPPARIASELEAQAFQPQRKPSSLPPSAPGNYSVSCFLFKTPVSIPSFPCPMLTASSETHQHLGDETLPQT